MLRILRIFCVSMLVVAGSITVATAADAPAGKTVEIHAKRFTFSPSEITVPKGQPVTLALTSDDVPHSLLIEGLGVNTAITKGKVADVTITPTQAGDFKGRCGRFCGSGHATMKFTVHVTDK